MAIFGVVLGCLILVHREINYHINLLEAEYYRYRAKEETNPTRKFEYAELAAKYDRLNDTASPTDENQVPRRYEILYVDSLLKPYIRIST